MSLCVYRCVADGICLHDYTANDLWVHSCLYVSHISDLVIFIVNVGMLLFLGRLRACPAIMNHWVWQTWIGDYCYIKPLEALESEDSRKTRQTASSSCRACSSFIRSFSAFSYFQFPLLLTLTYYYGQKNV